MFLTRSPNESVIGGKKNERRRGWGQSVAQLQRARKLDSVKSPQRIPTDERSRQPDQRFGVRNLQVIRVRVDGVRSEQKGRFFNGDSPFTVLPIAGRGYLQGSEKGLIKKRAAGLQKAADPDRPLLMKIALNERAGVEEKNHTRSSRSSMIWRLIAVSFFVIRKTRFMSTGAFIRPTTE